MVENLRQKLKDWFLFIFFFALIIVLAFIWYVTFSPSAWEETPNYLQMYFEFIVTRPTDAFLTVTAGPEGPVSFTFILTYALLIAHILLYWVGKQKGKQYNFVNKKYLIYLVLLALFAISFQNASEHYGWYWNPEVDAPGYVDTWTHITSPWLLGALIIPLALERYLGWDRKLNWLFILIVLAIVALVWEIGETIDIQIRPSATYFNYPMDSLKDMIMGVGVGGTLSSWIYNRLVIDTDEKAQTCE